jgi:tetratricopeptide (TPR) repeat protein
MLPASRGRCAEPPAAAPNLPQTAAASAPALAPNEGSIEQLWSRGESALKAGDPQEALRLFEAALSRDASRARSWNYLGGVHFTLGDLSRALQHFRRALELDPRDVRACNNIGTTLERLGEFAQAEEAYQRAATIDPAYPLTQRNLGLLQARRLGNFEAARRAWLRYLELAPNGAYADEVRHELEALPGTPPAPPAPAAASPAPPSR